MSPSWNESSTHNRTPHRKPYPSDLSDQEWAILKPLLPQPKGFGHPVEVDFREILNGRPKLFYGFEKPKGKRSATPLRYKGDVYGFDGGKQVKGRKRHIVVDTQGFVIGVLVTEANASERLGAIIVLDEAIKKLAKLQVIWVDQGYSGENFARVVKQVCGDQVAVEVIERTSKTFERLPKQWIVEITQP